MAKVCVRVGREPVGCRSTLKEGLALGARASKSARGAVKVTQASSNGSRKLIARCAKGRCIVVAGAKGLNGLRGTCRFGSVRSGARKGLCRKRPVKRKRRR